MLLLRSVFSAGPRGGEPALCTFTRPQSLPQLQHLACHTILDQHRNLPNHCNHFCLIPVYRWINWTPDDDWAHMRSPACRVAHWGFKGGWSSCNAQRVLFAELTWPWLTWTSKNKPAVSVSPISRYCDGEIWGGWEYLNGYITCWTTVCKDADGWHEVGLEQDASGLAQC